MKQNISKQNLSETIQNVLNCNESRVNEVINQLREAKDMFGLNMSLDEIWQQEMPYLVKFGDTSFNVGLLN